MSWSGHALSYVHAQQLANGTYEVLKFGVEQQGVDSTKHFVSRLHALGLFGLKTQVMLRPQQYQLLQINAPAVSPEELHSATGYLIKDLLKTPLNLVTLDIMQVGSSEDKKQPKQLFVVAAADKVLNEVMALGDAMDWDVETIGIQETAQRNLQGALARQDGHPNRANAALVVANGEPPVLTICANDQLFYAQKFELQDGFLDQSGDTDVATSSADNAADDNQAQRFLVDVQRSLDLWRRSWADNKMAINGVSIYAGKRSEEWSTWFKAKAGEAALPMDISGLFSGFSGGGNHDKALCMPLLGTLIQSLSPDQSQKINLLGHIKLPKKQFFSVQIMLQTLAVLVVLGGCLSTYWVVSLSVTSEEINKNLAMQSLELEKLQADIAQSKVDTQPSAALVQELEDSRTQLLQRENIAQALQRVLLSSGSKHGAKLHLVAQSIPAQAWVTKLKSDERQFEIKGFTHEPAALSKWVALLAASPVLEGQKISAVNIDKVSTSILQSADGTPYPTWSFRLLSVVDQASSAAGAMP